MNTTQLIIIVAIVLLIVFTIGYYLYQEIKFKKMVENNFNNFTKDIIDIPQSITLDGFSQDTLKSEAPIIQKDIIDVPSDSVEAIFLKINKIPFSFENSLDTSYIIDVAFDSTIKLKFIPDIRQYTNKKYTAYILDANNTWHKYVKATHEVIAFRIIIDLLDQDGIINQAQMANIYRELHQFVLKNNAYILPPSYDGRINKIQEQIKKIANIEFDLKLYLITKNNVNIAAMDAQAFKFNQVNDNLILVSLKLHLQKDPQKAVDEMFDFIENFTQKNEARLLTYDKKLFTEKDYNKLHMQIEKYITNIQKNNIELGSTLVNRLFSKF